MDADPELDTIEKLRADGVSTHEVETEFESMKGMYA